MTTINIPGKITAIEVDDTETIDVSIVSLVGGTHASPVVVLPTGKTTTVILGTSVIDPDGNRVAVFKFDASFPVGSVVKIRSAVPGIGTGQAVDENGVGVDGTSIRKIFTGSPVINFPDGSTQPASTWVAD